MQKRDLEAGFGERFTQYYLSFLRDVFGEDLPDRSKIARILTSLGDNASVDEQVRSGRRISHILGDALGGLATSPRAADLSASVNDHMGSFRRENFSDFVDNSFDFSTRRAPPRNDQDFLFTKINHGFWEQLVMLYARSPDAEKLRTIMASNRFARMYISSGFLFALQTLFLKAAVHGEGVIDLREAGFAISFGNGTLSSAELKANIHADFEALQVIYSGAAIGSAAFFSALFGPRKMQVFDSCYAKDGLLYGDLEKDIGAWLQSSSRLVFVVPPHLQWIRYAPAKDLPQDVFMISGTKVHESWTAALYSVSLQMLSRLARGEGVTIITQSGVFSALLGLFLYLAKRDFLSGKGGVLGFFDLGQILDMANQEDGGPWLRKRAASIDEDPLEVRRRRSMLPIPPLFTTLPDAERPE